MVRIRSTLTLGTATLALLSLTPPASAQQQPGEGHGTPEREGGPQAPSPQGPRQDAPPPHENARPGEARPQESARPAQPHPEASPHALPREDQRQQTPDGGRPAPKDVGPGQIPAQPRQQQEAERRREQEQRWQQQRTGQRPIREDVREVAHRDAHGRSFQVPTNDRVNVVTNSSRSDWAAAAQRRSFEGCPPGFGARYQNCAPPALAEPVHHRWNQPDWYGAYDRNTGYRYADGYLLRLGPNSAVASYVPLLGGALAVGRSWPGAYNAVALPDHYTRYYDLGPSSTYRYYDGVIYRVAPTNAAITAVAALLTGDAIAVGQPMPAGYDVYNVPYNYRDQYFDGPDALYRYSDGAIYQIDPATRLVRAAIELLA
ncbi:hypothetical protein EDF56_103496 [Novosphingobium sp. PhB165]|uniref:hypothetical protein n=1 Tax=Novosphingobium sp. PhB165 TaxID=2485105 RepID=UPI00104F8584|nr:hypothetical protein [Novosphingobium sp. PhB165]TCM19851.1 hypothetical protein EDF56_103496 [Novosphingobium sp. PhB165]